MYHSVNSPMEGLSIYDVWIKGRGLNFGIECNQIFQFITTVTTLFFFLLFLLATHRAHPILLWWRPFFGFYLRTTFLIWWRPFLHFTVFQIQTSELGVRDFRRIQPHIRFVEHWKPAGGEAIYFCINRQETVFTLSLSLTGDWHEPKICNYEFRKIIKFIHTFGAIARVFH